MLTEKVATLRSISLPEENKLWSPFLQIFLLFYCTVIGLELEIWSVEENPCFTET